MSRLTGFLLALSVAVLLCCAMGLACTGCSSGPQLPIVTVPINISCGWHSEDGGYQQDNDCMVDRSSGSADPSTIGVDNQGMHTDVSPQTSVTATP